MSDRLRAVISVEQIPVEIYPGRHVVHAAAEPDLIEGGLGRKGGAPADHEVALVGTVAHPEHVPDFMAGDGSHHPLAHAVRPIFVFRPHDDLGLLRQVPLGSTMEQVRALTHTNEWEVWPDWGASPERMGRSYCPDIDGARALNVRLGAYQGLPYWVTVDCSFCFVAGDGLVDVYILKVWDSP